MNKFKNYKAWLWGFFFLALAIRILYVFIGVHMSTWNSFFINGDSSSYTLSIINLFEKGVYSFDFQNRDAAFGRLPGYPLFWGIHYLLFKHSAYIAVAITQSILDASIVFLLFSIIRKMTGSVHAALLGSFLYAVYIFTIFWTPITGTESLGVFITVLFIYVASKDHYNSPRWYIALGLCAAIAFYIREYLGILFPIAGLYFLISFLKRKITFLHFVLYCGAFMTLYVLWPLRNYISYGRVEFLKPPTAGYDRYGKDIASFRSWVYTWNIDIEPYITRIVNRQPAAFPKNVIKDTAEQEYINQLLDVAMTCGSSFYVWKHQVKYSGTNCDTYISKAFDSLRLEYIKRSPLTYYIKVPAMNFQKAFFKNNLNKASSSATVRFLTSLMFGWRTVLILIGFAGLVAYHRSFVGFVLAFFPVFMYVFICCIVRQVEMRYLLQADVCLLVYVIYFLNAIQQMVGLKNIYASHQRSHTI